MRSVVLRSRPGRPWWQLTTRPPTAAVLGLVSLAAAAVQVALLSSPPPWYQFAVAGFWTVVGVAFLASAVGTRVRSRRQAATRARRPIVAEPFVPVPVVPARRRANPARSAASDAPPAPSTSTALSASADDEAGAGAAREADSGAPTADLTDAVPTVVHPAVTAVVPAPLAGTGSGLALAARLAAPSPAGGGAPAGREVAAEAVADPDEPTTRLPRESGRPARNRHAVRAVLSAEFAARALEEESERMATGRSPLRDGRVRPAEATPASVPRPRETPDEAPTSHTRTSPPRPAHTPTPSTGVTPARTSHRRPRRRRGEETVAPDPHRDGVPEPRQALERAGRRSGAPESAAPRPSTAAPTPAAPTPAASTPAAANPAAPIPAGGAGTPETSAQSTPPSLPAAPRPRTPVRRASALTFGTPDTADAARSSAGGPTRAPGVAGRHARIDESDRGAREPRSARHAAVRGRR